MVVKKPVDAYASFTAAATDTTVYEVSSNRKLTVTDVIITNKETGAILVTIKDGATTKLEVKIAGNDTGVIKLNNGITFRTSVVAQVDTYANGSSIWIGGYEE